MGVGEFTECSRMCRDPLTLVGVGSVECVASEAEISRVIEASSGGEETARTVRAVQTGIRGAIVEVSVEYANSDNKLGIVLVGKQDEEWLIAGLSRVWT